MKARRLSGLRKTKLAAFTLLECLIALLIISGSLLVIEGLSKLIAHEVRYQERHVEKQWLLFCDQLRAEWEGASLDRVDSGKLYLTKGEKSLAFGKSVADDFRKTNANGQGYQPMLYKVYSATYAQQGEVIQLDVTFESGEERSCRDVFEKTN